MTPAELREYAETLIFDYVRDIPPDLIRDQACQHLGHLIDDVDADEVDALLTQATITISWPPEVTS